MLATKMIKVKLSKKIDKIKFAFSIEISVYSIFLQFSCMNYSKNDVLLKHTQQPSFPPFGSFFL